MPTDRKPKTTYNADIWRLAICTLFWRQTRQDWRWRTRLAAFGGGHDVDFVDRGLPRPAAAALAINFSAFVDDPKDKAFRLPFF